MQQNKVEYWLRGPLPQITPLLQPVAHALLQAQSEIIDVIESFANDWLWQTPAGVASPAFHLQHMAGVLDRLFTYAKGQALTAEQLTYLSKEGKMDEEITVQFLLDNLHRQIEQSLQFLQETEPQTLTETRYVGRNRIPSTQLGLLFHAAEHTMRHTGQLIVTVKLITEENKKCA